jgi:hypothetical protein
VKLSAGIAGLVLMASRWTRIPLRPAYIEEMSRTKKKSPGKREYQWRITRIPNTPARELGRVTAPDAKNRNRPRRRRIFGCRKPCAIG